MKTKVFVDRELSWIDFNLRVLDEADKKTNPIFERFNFAAIFESNYDEFFRVRVGSLCDKYLVNEDDKAEKIKKQLENIYKATAKAVKQLDLTFDTLMKDSKGVMVRVNEDNTTAEEYDKLKVLFEREIAPISSPFIVEKKSPFPFFENGRRVVGVTLGSKNQKNLKFGFIPVSNELPSCVILKTIDDRVRFVLIEDLLMMFADKIFHKYTISEKTVFSIIRNADIDENEGLYDYDIDFRDTMSKLIEVRKKLAPVELKYCGKDCDKIIAHLKNVLYLKKLQIINQTTPLSLSFMSEVKRKRPQSANPELYYPPLKSQYPKQLKGGNLIKKIRRKDVLLSYPFDDVAALIDLLHEASSDKNVRSIDISLYRVAKNSKIVRELINAAENGKRVSCMVELRARFDEENNIDWSRRLEEAGCRVYYGLPNYKVHCKLIHIGLSDGSDIVQVGTGNFNEKTAKLYTDLALFTANEDIVRDVKAVFNALKDGRFVKRSKTLLVAPLCLKSKLFDLIDEQIDNANKGLPAQMEFKFNSLTDKELMSKLVEASNAGVKTRLLIRGICCLVPGIPGKTENIEVRSIVGRFLEHSRIYVFGVGRDKKYYISSADFMTRNTDQRVEVAAPVTNYSAKRKLAHIMRLGFADNTNARELSSDGKYHEAKVRGAEHNMQSQLFSDVYKSGEKNEVKEPIGDGKAVKRDE